MRTTSSQFHEKLYYRVKIELTIPHRLRQVPNVQSVETLPITGTVSVDLEITANTDIPSLASVTPTVPAAPVNSVAPAATVAVSTDTPAEIPINPTTVAPAVPPITPPAPPAALTLIAAASPHEAGTSQDASIFVTIQWLETWIGGTSRTWLPHTITLYQGAPVRTAPLPGKGQIGMGTLTGELGITRTVVQGGAKTAGPEWKMGAVAAVGMGIVGII